MRLFFVLLLFLSQACGLRGQCRGDIRVMFYNVENLFDTEDDPRTNDDEFTPLGNYHWNKAKYSRKLWNIYKVIAGIGGWQPPEIVGMAEIENRQVLTDLVKTTPLSKVAYQVVHFDSPDPRGIDVALLYRPDKLSLVGQCPIGIHFKNAPGKKTRDILYARFMVNKQDTLNVFVNHWPSRRDGEMESEELRICAATVLRKKTDSLFLVNSRSKIVIMGDFNDEPANVSVSKYLNATGAVTAPVGRGLYNISAALKKTSSTGTHYFKGQWAILDQVIVSYGLLNALSGIYTKTTDGYIFSQEFLLQTDLRNLSRKPFPTYSGPKYLGGFSDHLPIYLDLFLKK